MLNRRTEHGKRLCQPRGFFLWLEQATGLFLKYRERRKDESGRDTAGLNDGLGAAAMCTILTSKYAVQNISELVLSERRIFCGHNIWKAFENTLVMTGKCHPGNRQRKGGNRFLEIILLRLHSLSVFKSSFCGLFERRLSSNKMKMIGWHFFRKYSFKTQK